MYLSQDRLVLSPTDLTHHQECPHLTPARPRGRRGGVGRLPDGDDAEELQFVFDRGLAHEKKYLASLMAAGKTIAEIDTVFDAEGRVAPRQQTVEAMRRGVDVVYQGTFFDGAGARPGRLPAPRRRRPATSATGPTRSPTPSSPASSRSPRCCRWPPTPSGSTVLQGRGAASSSTSITGDGDIAAVAAGRRRRLRPPRAGATWRRCVDRRRRPPTRADRPLRAVPLGRAVQHRAAAGRRRPRAWSPACAATTATRCRDGRHRARSARPRRSDSYRASTASAPSATLAPESSQQQARRAGRGAAPRRRRPTNRSCRGAAARPRRCCPPPDARRPLLRLRGRPLVRGRQGIEYLAGLGDTARAASPRCWAHDRPAEKQMVVEPASTRLIGRCERRPGHARLPLRALRGDRAQEADRRLRRPRGGARPAAARASGSSTSIPSSGRSMRISKESYSIKKVEEFYSPAAHEGARSRTPGQRARVRASGSQSATSRSSTRSRPTTRTTSTRPATCTTGWSRRDDARGARVPRPEGAARHRPTTTARPTRRVVAAEAALTAAVPDDPGERTPEPRTRAAAASLVQWHRREDRPEWWDVLPGSASSTRDDARRRPRHASAACAPADASARRRSPPSGVTGYLRRTRRLRSGDRVDHATPAAAEACWSAHRPDRPASSSSAPEPTSIAHPHGLIAGRPGSTKGPAAAIAARRRVGGRPRHRRRRPATGRVRDLVLSLAPRLPEGVPLRQPGEDGIGALCRVAPRLGGVLAIQGPPGSGKTYAGAHADRRAGPAPARRSASRALSHRVIGNLLDAVMALDDESGRIVRALQKAEDDDGSTHDRRRR